ncbi:MAG: hypothetical protein A2X32_00300 [Elusimicrobia bacterium GWC2_64_44]|nr:MAG: hypothetical protein A2X32_00300 [Elusimicrobia bacterium GWC2_64_44]
MAHKFNCAVCGKEIVVKWLNPGDTAKCRACGASSKVPESAAHVPDDYASAAPAPALAEAPARPGCAACRYLESSPTDNLEGVGFCRRYPPRPGEGWAAVTAADWCGEHAPKEAAGA